ncbi:hypothetical protein GCM10027341_56500 [Spirosoma knui]
MTRVVTQFSAQTNSVVAGTISYDIANIIDRSYTESDMSPIDSFISNGIEINRLFTSNPSQVLGNLIILGYVSAIESYFRAVFRRLIIVDAASQSTCEKKHVFYGAVLHHDDSMLPEALFEDISFAGRKNILSSISNFLGIPLQESNIPEVLKSNLDQFEGICELRHCIVHRFGKFGSRNAISLGLSEHSINIEKPIKCDFASLQQIVAVCQNTVRITNNFLFEKIINRLILSGNTKILDPVWTWDYDRDKVLFGKYYKIFYSKLNPPALKITQKKLYTEYHNHYKTL